jgi:uncharacterized membrane protein YphA (DoxX/SURF4 family)
MEYISMIKKTIYSIICTLIGAVFILSGFTKLFPIEPFEFTFVDLGFINWQVAPIIARFMIGAEFLIGILLVLNVNLKKITYKLAVTMLVFFCIYLLLLILIVGNKGNCGCFGSYIQMTPMQALIKNIVILSLFFILNKNYAGWELNKKYRLLIIIPCAFAILLPFILNPVELNYSEAYLNKPEANYKLELDSLYTKATLHIPSKSLSKGKHIIAFISMTCPHCRIAAKKIRIIHERNPKISFYFVLNGERKSLKPFFDDTHSENIPYCLLNGKNFVYLAGTSVPKIYLVNNGRVEHEVNYFSLDQDEIERWLKR